MTEETVTEKLARYETVLDLQMKELDRLRAENERLRDGADAHSTLQSIYRNPASPEGNRIKAAAASLPVEKPKLMSIGPPIELNRRERWRVLRCGRSGGSTSSSTALFRPRAGMRIWSAIPFRSRQAMRCHRSM